MVEMEMFSEPLNTSNLLAAADVGHQGEGSLL